jgi:hypothetical protein
MVECKTIRRFQAPVPPLTARLGEPMSGFVSLLAMPRHVKPGKSGRSTWNQEAYGHPSANLVWKHPKSASPSTPSPLQSA